MHYLVRCAGLACARVHIALRRCVDCAREMSGPAPEFQRGRLLLRPGNAVTVANVQGCSDSRHVRLRTEYSRQVGNAALRPARQRRN